MSAAQWFATLLLLTCSAPALAGCAEANADEQKYGPRARPPASAQASAGAGAQATALKASEVAPPAATGPGPWEPDFSAAPPPAERSKAPALTEWLSAPEAKEARVADPGCKVQRIREWYRVSCEHSQTVELVTGKVDEVTIGTIPDPKGQDWSKEGYVILPMRRGDRRAFEVFVPSRWAPAADTLITAQFIDGDPLPLISVHGVRWGF